MNTRAAIFAVFILGFVGWELGRSAYAYLFGAQISIIIAVLWDYEVTE